LCFSTDFNPIRKDDSSINLEIVKKRKPGSYRVGVNRD
jgi:hypothetical protein